MARQHPLDRAASALRKLALSYPGAREEFPWGHSAFKIKGKIFLSVLRDKDILSLSLKLPESAQLALSLPFASPTRYGLGKSGWVTAKFQGQEDVPLELLSEWIAESFRAISPKPKRAAKLAAGKPAAKRKRAK